MSRYTNQDDFCDLFIDKFNNDFEFFIKETGGVIELYLDEQNSVYIQIKNISDLIIYYPYKVISCRYKKDVDFLRGNYLITLKSSNLLLNQIKQFTDLNKQFGNIHFKEPFRLKELIALQDELNQLHIKTLEEFKT